MAVLTGGAVRTHYGFESTGGRPYDRRERVALNIAASYDDP
jgi:hypothetical protein